MEPLPFLVRYVLSQVCIIAAAYVIMRFWQVIK